MSERKQFERPAQWRQAAVELIRAENRGWVASEVARVLGNPPGRSSASAELAQAAQYGFLRFEGVIGSRRYFTGTAQRHTPKDAFQIVGRGAPQFASVWDYAGRAAA